MAKDYYEILGVPADADIELIKRQYRILVREYHPDVAPDKEAAHARTLLIFEAWKVLSEPAARARYDRQRHTAADNATGTPKTTPTRQDRAAGISAEALRKERMSQNFKHNRNATSSSNPRTRLLNLVFDAAQLYYQGNVAEAVTLCTRVMKSDLTNAEAPALLGDIYAEQNRRDVALLMYERAMRNQPNNMLYRQKWQAIKNGEVIPPAPQAGTDLPTNGTAPDSNPQPAPPPPAASAPGTAGVAQPVAPPEPPVAASATPPAPPPEPEAPFTPPVAPEVAVAEPERASFVGKLTGWMGKRK